jgi:uncharacterized protein GlcG (DUF336 family)
MPTAPFIRLRRIIDDRGAEEVAVAAQRHALANGYRVVIAVVDPFGGLVHLRRTPGAQIASSRVAVDKARTAAIFARPSRAIEEQVSRGRLGALALRGAAALTGGIPLRVEGEVVGAIGTSGETPDQDESVSMVGAQVTLSPATRSPFSPSLARASSPRPWPPRPAAAAWPPWRLS